MANKKEVTLTPAIDAPAFDLSGILPTIAPALDGLAKLTTAREAAKIKCLAFADMVTASTGSLDVLNAHAKSKATDAMKAAHVKLKLAYFGAKWGEAFTAWVTGEGADAMKSPKRGQKANNRRYWQMQMGDFRKDFVANVLAFVEERDAAAKGKDATHKTPKAIDVACKEHLTSAVKRMKTAIADGKDVPAGINTSAFIALATLAIEALEPGRTKQARAHQALQALRAGKLLV